MQAARQEEIHGGKFGFPGGIHAGAGDLDTKRLHKQKGVPLFIEDSRFKFLKTLHFKVPEDHSSDDPALTFLNKKMGNGYKPTTSFKTGREVKVTFYELVDGPTREECLFFIERKGGLFVGTEGLFLSWIALGKELPEECWLISLDGKETLTRDDCGNPRTLGVFKSSIETIKPELYNVRLDGPLSCKNCLMIFTYA